MDQRMGAYDQNLNARIGGEADGAEFGDMLADPAESHETLLGEDQELQQKRSLMLSAIASLNPREREIIEARRLAEDPATLEDLSQRYSISRERVRQIETRALEKMTQHVMETAKALADKSAAAILPAHIKAA